MVDEERVEAIRAALREASTDAGMFRPEERGPLGRHGIGELRRRRSAADTLGTITLVDEDGTLRWERRSPVSSLASGRRSMRRRGRAGVIIEQLRFESLEPALLGAFLRGRDGRLNPRRGLSEVAMNGERFALVEHHPSSQRIRRVLLLVHDLFGSGEHMLDEITSTRPGREKLARWMRRYDRVLAFEHPTLSVSSLANAVDLMRAMDGVDAVVDVVAHGRGGVVARWWLESLRRPSAAPGRAVFVGAPLAGTSVATPSALKRTLDLLTNVWNVLEKAGALLGTAAPLATVIVTIAKVLGSVTKLVASSPLLDGMLGTIPGIVSLSRDSTNFEIERLRAASANLDRYAAVRANFEPSPVGWRFWRAFTEHPRERLADAGLDVVFRGPNDLLVDTHSMTDFDTDHSVAPERILTLGRLWNEARGCHEGPANPLVHHFNYFESSEVLSFIDRSLEVP